MADLLNKKYILELEVLTPLHVGAGQEKDLMKGADYIVDNDKIYILNHKKIAKLISAKELANFLITKNDKGLSNKLAGNLNNVSDIIFKSPVNSANDIKSFVKNGLTNKPIVPGSSVKGAIRSILMNYFIDNVHHIDQRDKRFEEKIFGSANVGDEFMRFIKIADAQFDKTVLMNTKIFNLYGTAPNLNGGWKHEFRGGTNGKFKPNGFNTIYEIIKPNEIGELSIALSDKAFDNFYKNNSPDKKSEILHQEPSQKLFSIINNHTISYIKKQIGFFEKYSNNETPDIIKSLNRVLDQIPDDNASCVLKMSAGSGFHSITGDWQFDDFSINGVKSGSPSRGQLNRQKSTKSRKIATDGATFDLMGFVKISILTDEIIAEREVAKKAKIEAKEKAKKELEAKEKAEQDRIKALEQAKLEAERKAKEERIAKEKAAKLEIEKLLKEKKVKLLKAQIANKDKKAKEAEDIVSQGLSELEGLNDFNKGKKIIETYFKANGETIGDQQYEHLKNFISSCINKKNKRWKKEGKQDWVLVVKWIGKDTAKQWYNDTVNN